MAYSSKDLKEQISRSFRQAGEAKTAVRNAPNIDPAHSVLFRRGIDDAQAKLVQELEAMLRVAEAFEAGGSIDDELVELRDALRTMAQSWLALAASYDVDPRYQGEAEILKQCADDLARTFDAASVSEKDNRIAELESALREYRNQQWGVVLAWIVNGAGDYEQGKDAAKRLVHCNVVADAALAGAEPAKE